MRIKLGFPMVSCHRKHKRVGAALIAAAGLTWIFIKLVATLTSSNAGYIIHESLIIFFNIKYLRLKAHPNVPNGNLSNLNDFPNSDVPGLV